MTHREAFTYTLRVCILWALIHWRPIALAIGAAAIVLLLSGCYVGIIPTNTPTLTSTPWLTNTPTASYTLTAVNISPTAEATPTQETDCAPHYWAIVWAYTNLYANPGLTVKLLVNGNPVILRPGDAVLLLETDDYAYRVVTADGERVEGWIPFFVLPVECQ